MAIAALSRPARKNCATSTYQCSTYPSKKPAELCLTRPEAILQTCIIHLIRNTFRLTSRRYWDELKRDVKPIYTADSPVKIRAGIAVVGMASNGAEALQRVEELKPQKYQL